jgi:hypothetical protein
VQGGRAVRLGDDGVLELLGRTAQTGRALVGIEHERCQLDQVCCSADPCDHRPSVGVAEDDRGLGERVDDGLYGGGVSSQRAAVELRYSNLGSVGPQPFRQHRKVLGTVIQAVNKHHSSQLVRLLRSTPER